MMMMMMMSNNKALLVLVLAAVSLSSNVLSVNNNVVGVHAQEVAASAHAHAHVPVPADRGGRKLKQSKFSKSKSKTSKSSKTRRPRTSRPTPAPTNEPTVPPTDATTDAPTNAPTNAPTDAPTNAPPELDIPKKVEELGFSSFHAALTAADLVGALSNSPDQGPFTVMAPTNKAIDFMGDTLNACLLLPRNVKVLRNILSYHVANGKVLSVTDTANSKEMTTRSHNTLYLVSNQVITMWNDESIVINIDNGGTVIINENSVVERANVMATNGVIHTINRVLVPPSLNITEFLETCANAPTL